MKKSEFEQRVFERGVTRQLAQTTVALAEQAGVKWDPEEPDLPERVEVRDVGSGTYLGTHATPDTPEIRARLVDEAAARYNAWGRLFPRLGGEAADYAERFLEEERRWELSQGTARRSTT